MAASTAQKFGRSATLLLTHAQSSSGALDLSNLRFNFRVLARDQETPNVAYVRVYNPTAQTVKEIQAEYDGVVLSVGYGDNAGQIFKGTVKQFVRGKERNVDNFLEIRAADGDLGYNFGFANKTLEAGTTQKQEFDALCESLGYPADPRAEDYIAKTGGILPRGKVLFGLARAYMRDLASTVGARWSIQNGVVTLVPLDNYLSGEPIAVNSATGMVGVPEATDQGIRIEMLLNPNVQVGQAVKLNNADITEVVVKDMMGFFFPTFTGFTPYAQLDRTNDGLYRVIVVEHEGDTRDQAWYTRLICLSIDPSSPSAPVQPYGG